MIMIMTIVKRRFLDNLLTSRFLIAAVLIEILFVSSTAVLIRDYGKRQHQYRTAVQEHREQLQQVPTWAMLSVRIDRPPLPMSVFSAGADRRLAKSVAVAHNESPAMVGGAEADNPLLAVFSGLDMITVIQVVLSLAVLLFSYNIVSGEKENGTLRLVLANKVPRHVFLAGNFIGGLASIMVPLLAGFISALLLVLLHPAISLAGSDILRLLLLFPAAVLFLSLFFTLGVLFSILMKRSSTSLVVLLFIWVFFVMILPPAVVYVARYIRPVESQSVVDQQADKLRGEWRQEMVRYTESHPRPEHDWSMIRGRSVMTGDLPYAYHLGFAPREVAGWMIDGSIYGHNLRIDYENRVYTAFHDYEQRLFRQADLANELSRISPAWVFFKYASIIAATDATAQLRFLEQAEQYRQRLIQYIRDKDGLSGYRLITYHPAESFPSTAELEAIRRTRGKEGVEAVIGNLYSRDAAHSLNLSDLPEFNYMTRGPMESLFNALPELAILVLLNILLAAACWASFLRADVR